MKYSLTLIAFVISFWCNANAQLLSDRLNLAGVRAFEAAQGSQSKGFVSQNVGAGLFHGAEDNGEYHPLVFVRTNDHFDPRCEIEYYYSPKDSVINAILYDWNIMSQVKNLRTDGAKLELQVGRKDAYVAQYNAVRAELTAKYGAPSSTEDISESNNTLFGQTVWNLADKDLTLTVMFSTKLKSAGQFKFGSFRVRLITDWKQ